MFYLFHLAENSRLSDKSSFAVVHLKKCALKAVERVNSDGGGFCYLTGDRRLRIQGSGSCNLKKFMLDIAVHRNVIVALEKLWEDMKEESIVSSEFDAASFLDLTVFLAKSIKFKRQKASRSLSQHCMVFFTSLRNSVVKFLASTLDVIVMQAQVSGVLEQRQIPSRGRRSRQPEMSPPDTAATTETENQSGSRPRKGRVSVDLETIWRMHEHANELGLSLPVYVQTKEHDPQGGCHGQTAQMWLRKLYNMYAARSALSFKNAHQLNVVADASRFSSRETLISVAYSPENDVGVYLNNQFVRSGKLIGPGDLLMEDTIEVLAAQRKVTRQASYNLLQAVSNQIKHLTNGEMNITSFDYEGTNIGFAVKPLDPGKLRVSTYDDEGPKVFVQDKQSKTLTKIDLSGAEAVKVMTLSMDQGTTGMAVASFLGGPNSDSCHMVHHCWDPFHRLARDMKLAMLVSTVADRGLRQNIKSHLQHAHLCSTFLWSINYKPFNSAAFHQGKMELLEHFMAVEDEDWRFFE